MATCTIDGCGRKHKAQGLCRPHYSRLLQYGDVRPDVPIGGPALAERFWSKVDVRGNNECWEWAASRLPQGYGMFRLGAGTRRAHRVAYELAVDSIPDGMWVLHQCDNPPCCNPAHLSIGTPSDNSQDRKRRGRQSSRVGVNNGRALLTEPQVLDILKMAGAGMVKTEIAKTYGTSPSAIYLICSGRNWSHLPRP